MPSSLTNTSLIIKTLALNNLKIRYKRSTLGFMWSLLNPLLNIGLIGIVFSQIMQMPYKEFIIFLMPGIMAWNLFANTINGSTTAIIHNEGLIMNTSIDRIVFPIVILVSMLVDFILALSFMLLLLYIFVIPVSIACLLIPLAVVLLATFSLGIGLVVCILNTYWRDMAHIINILLQIMFLLTPVLYPVTRLSEYIWVAKYNPLYYLIELFRLPIYKGHIPEMHTILIAIIASLTSCILGYIIFRIYENKIVFRL
jgi:ABC-type polysaccharide/polyol phosphate export permease